MRTAIRHQLTASWHINAIHIGESDRRGGWSKNYFLSARLSSHLHNLIRGRATHNRVIHNQYRFIFELNPHCIELLAYGFLTHRLTRHDEGTTDVTVLKESFTIRNAQTLSHLHGSRTTRIRDRHYHINLAHIGFCSNLLSKIVTHPHPHVINRDPINRGVWSS